MCSQYPMKVPPDVIARQFRETGIELLFPEGAPNLEPRDVVTIGDTAPIVAAEGESTALLTRRFGWKGQDGRPVFNFRSDGRRFDGTHRCLVPASGFFEFTDPQPGQKRKTRWRFTMAGCDWFWMVGIVRDGAFALLTTTPGEDVAPYHDRQVVVLSPDRGAGWLTLDRPEAELLAPAPPGSLQVARDFPSPELF